MRSEPITKKLKEWHLQYYGNVVHADPDTVKNVAYTLQVAGKQPPGWLKQRWADCLKANMEYLKAKSADSQDHLKWRKLI